MAPSRFEKVLLLVILFIGASLQVQSESENLKFKFTNGVFDIEKNTYAVDIEVLSNQENTLLHAMNARFFYEASTLEFRSFEGFKTGYGFVNELEDTHIGGKGSAKKMFSLTGHAGYLNQGIALLDPTNIEWKTGEWQKLVTVKFKVINTDNLESLCPSFIWDKNIDQNLGGYLKGSMGATASTVTDIGSKMKCNSAESELIDYNWFKKSKVAPFGTANFNACVAKDFERMEELDNTILIQNQPNPFVDLTNIDFYLAKKESVTLSIYKENGVIVHEDTKVYDQGSHTISVNRDIIPVSGIYLYKIETLNYHSDLKKMIKVD